MITFLLGLPGSGKSYKAVDYIWNNFSNDEQAKPDKKQNFKNCYTNINEFKFDEIVNVNPLDFEKLYEILKRAHALYKQKKSDKKIVRFLQLCKLKNTLFVIDEAHNFFDKKDLVLVWWLSYHRHLFHEIILITQNLSLIESKYKAFSEFFYVAKPRSLSLFTNEFKYNIFCSQRLSQNSKSGSIKLNQNKKVFALYHSGDSIKTKNIVLKFIFITIFFLLLAGSILYYQISSMQSKPIETKSTPTSVIQQVQNKPSTQIKTIQADRNDYLNRKFFTLLCGVRYCTNEDIKIPTMLLAIFFKEHQIERIYDEKINDTTSIYYLNSSLEFYDFLNLNKGDTNENSLDFSGSSLVPSFGK
jgi:zona occludens toxin